MGAAEGYLVTVERAQVGWTFWLQWVLASTVGFTLAYEVVRFFGPFAFYVLFAPEYALMGVVVGIPQWLVLRQQVPGVGPWVLATVVGFAVGGTLAFVTLVAAGYYDLDDLVGRAVSPFLLSALFFAPIGPVVGIAQWIVLRRRIKAAGWWVLANIVAWVLFGALEGLPAVTKMSYYDVRISVISAIGGLLAGAVTGVTLVWLLRQRVPEG